VKRGEYFEVQDTHLGWVTALINEVVLNHPAFELCDITVRYSDRTLHRFKSTLHNWSAVADPPFEIPLDWVHPNVGILVEGTYVFHASYGHCVVVTPPTTDSMVVRYEATRGGKTIWVLYGSAASEVLYIAPADTWSLFLAQDKTTPYLQVET
jgi:hypothetical protein